jgi:hypothetical protein
MSDNSSRELQPVVELRRAVIGGTVAFLAPRAVLRTLLGAIGAILFVFGLIAVPFWNVPLLSWLSVGQLASSCLGGGLSVLGIWYLSRNGGVSRAALRPTETARRVHLVDQLERLKDLHNSADLTDEEYKRAKSLVLD